MVTVSKEGEPLRMPHALSETWKEVAGRGVQAVKMDGSRVCHQSEFQGGDTEIRQEVGTLRILIAMGSDNGPPSNGQEFQDFGKYLGWQHKTKTVLDPTDSVFCYWI